MKTKTWLFGSLTMALSLAATGVGCFSDPATCDSICALPDAPPGTTCETDCTATQTACASASASSDFQAYLTCVENEGSYVATDEGCKAPAALVASECSSTPAAPVDGGSAGDAEGVSPPGSTLDAAPPFSGPCVLGAACGVIGATCTISGGGPCGSDERLTCGAADALVADGFPCTEDPNVGCGFGTSTSTDSDSGPGCSESCSCVDGLEVCTGNCPDAGPMNP